MSYYSLYFTFFCFDCVHHSAASSLHLSSVMASVSLLIIASQMTPRLCLSLTLLVSVSNTGGESGRRRSPQRAGELPDPGDESRPGLLPLSPGPPDLLGVGPLPVYLPSAEVGRAEQQRGGDQLLRHHPGRPNHHCGIRDESPGHRPAAGQRVQVQGFMWIMNTKNWAGILTNLLLSFLLRTSACCI